MIWSRLLVTSLVLTLGGSPLAADDLYIELVRAEAQTHRQVEAARRSLVRAILVGDLERLRREIRAGLDPFADPEPAALRPAELASISALTASLIGLIAWLAQRFRRRRTSGKLKLDSIR